MKPLLLISLFFIIASASAQHQDLKVGPGKRNGIDSMKMQIEVTAFKVMDASASATVAKIDTNGELTVYDSLKTIQVLLQTVKELSDQRDAEKENGYFLSNIVRYMDVNGVITDKRSFDNSVKIYLEYLKNKPR